MSYGNIWPFNNIGYHLDEQIIFEDFNGKIVMKTVLLFYTCPFDLVLQYTRTVRNHSFTKHSNIIQQRSIEWICDKIDSLNQLEDSVTQNLFRQYMFRQTINLSQATLVEVPYANNAGVKSAIKYTAANQVVYLDGANVAFPYNTLDYVKVNGAVDGSSGIAATDSVDVVIPCQTTGIKTSTGTTLHVLANSAILNKL